MGLIGWLAEQREKLILGPAYANLASDENVLQWVRARQPGTRREGFVYVTPHQVIVRWTSKVDGHQAFRWQQISSWGINSDLPGGPALAIENDDQRVVVQMPVLTHATAAEVQWFMRRFAGFAPTPRRGLHNGETLPCGKWRAEPPARVHKSKRTAAELTKRWLVSILGAVMVIGGLVITPLPGPWSFPIVLAGLAVLSSEYDWAKDALMWARHKYNQAKRRIRQRRSART